MNAKKVLLQAARKQSHKKEIRKMSEAKAVDLLRSIKKGKEDK